MLPARLGGRRCFDLQGAAALQCGPVAEAAVRGGRTVLLSQLRCMLAVGLMCVAVGLSAAWSLHVRSGVHVQQLVGRGHLRQDAEQP